MPLLLWAGLTLRWPCRVRKRGWLLSNGSKGAHELKSLLSSAIRKRQSSGISSVGESAQRSPKKPKGGCLKGTVKTVADYRKTQPQPVRMRYLLFPEPYAQACVPLWTISSMCELKVVGNGIVSSKHPADVQKLA